MKNSIRVALVAVALAGAVGAHADSFEVAAGTTFTEYFTFTPTVTDRAVLSVSGLKDQFSSLSFELTGGPAVTGTLQFGSLLAGFNDGRNASYNLVAGTDYLLKISGQTFASLPGTFGRVSITAVKGTVSPVPEPESYAMFLAGLGLMAAIARRRSRKE